MEHIRCSERRKHKPHSWPPMENTEYTWFCPGGRDKPLLQAVKAAGMTPSGPELS